MPRWLLAGLCICLLGAGCTLKAYPGPDRDAAQVARIAPAGDLHRSVYLDRIDGVEIGALRDRVEVLPGTHRLLATLLTRVGGQEVSGKLELVFEARAAHTYRVHGAWGIYGPHLWVTESGTDTRVADVATSPRGLPGVGAGSR